MTLQDVAKLAGVTRQAVCLFELGPNPHTFRSIERYAKALGVRPDWLATGNGLPVEVAVEQALHVLADSQGSKLRRVHEAFKGPVPEYKGGENAD